jgi:hypothetical protein
MNRKSLLLAAVLAVAGIAAQAETPDPSGQFAARPTNVNTRAQVAAELQQARQAGDILAAGEQGLTPYELNPRAYPARTVVAGKSRNEVRAEMLAAIRDGDIISQGELGLPDRALYPQHYAPRGRGLGEQTAGR